MNRSASRILPGLICASLLLQAGCRTTPRPTTPGRSSAPELARAEAYLQQGRMAEAIIETIELERKYPLMPGLGALQERIMTRLADERHRSMEHRDATSPTRMLEDAARHRIVPETYHLRRHIRGDESPLHTLPSPMQEALTRPVSVHLTNVMLDEFIAQIGMAENINIVADSDLSDRSISIHADETPLNEILEFVGRNLGVTFSVGRNIIWVTSAAPQPAGAQPLETRIYRLRKGLSGEEIVGGPGSLGILEAVERFVPATDGADLMFSLKAHALLARNTRENLTLIEDLIHALDVRPPQVLIEARFTSATVSDLRELGVDWILNSPLVVSQSTVMRDGRPVQVPRTQLTGTGDEGAALSFTPFESASQGLSLAYEGVLTDPMFRAVIHALETSGKARTLSVPRVTTVNNRPARIRIGEDFRFFEQYDVVEVRDGTTDGGTPTYTSRLVPTGTPQLEELGIELEVSPSVGADLATINLTLLPEISEFVRWEYYETGDTGTASRNTNSSTNDVSISVIKLPIFRRSTIETELVVRSGETVVMGGLVTTTDQHVREGVPILSSLPWIGQFFRHDRTEKRQQNLIIFVTATLISDAGESLYPINPPTLPGADAPEQEDT